jgi:hypothetical protein
MNDDKIEGDGMTRRETWALALVASAGAVGCQLDPGNFNAYQPISSRGQVATIFVEDTGGGVTLEHWAFTGTTDYVPTRGVETQPSRDRWDLRTFTSEMCNPGPVKKYLKVSTTEYPLACGSPTPPSVTPPADGVLGDGSYRVLQSGVNVGTVFVSNHVEHWGVSGSFNRRSGFVVEPISELTYQGWASLVCGRYNPRTYWVVTSQPGTLCT